jgi:hypothetical protein
MSLALRVSPEFEYVGSFVFDLAAGARVDRHVFADGSPSPRRLIVVQFEAFLPGVDDHYRYALRDPARIGGEIYGRSSGVLSVREERAASPDAEIARTADYLASRALAFGDRHAVARFARIVGDDRRQEILVFYHEVDGSPEGILDRAERAIASTAAPDTRA